MKKLIATIILIIPFASIALGQSKEKKLTGQILYNQHCAPCHQADGSGVAGLNPPLSKTIYVLGDKKRLVNIVLKGLNTVLEIDDEIYNNVMPPLNSLTDQQIADVLTFVRSNFQNKASAVTAPEVKMIRANKK